MYLIPEPQQLTLKSGAFTFHYDEKIVIDPSCSDQAYGYASLLQEEMKASAGYGLAITRGKSKKTAVLLKQNSALKEEEYTLEVNGNGICIEGGADRGLLYGIQTLRQMIRQEGMRIPCVCIQDAPAIKNRVYHFDVTRGRIPTLAYLKKMADRMAFYKMNQMQLYIEHTFLFEDLSEVWRDDTPLTAEEIMELDRYCRKLNIELVPSLSCFGHLYKVLSTRSYADLSELPESEKMPFSFVGRMEHHTVDVTNEESFAFIKSRIEEFMPLFTSEYFNIGADETFDLGKGRSRELADRVGVDRIYLDFVKRVCEFVIEKGRKPMFWGDIICSFPEAIKELPASTICLNWGYSRDQSDESVRKLAQAGAVQYVCPGVNGWNQLVADLEAAYENIRRMCSYALTYGAEGVLLTEWGDYGHINHPDFEIPGMIYGAAFSWNQKVPSFEEINKRISRLEFGDRSESLVSTLARIAPAWVFKWYHAVYYKENRAKAFPPEKLEGTEKALRELEAVGESLCEILPEVSGEWKGLIHSAFVSIRGMELIQKAGVLVTAQDYHTQPVIPVDAKALAGELEEWFMYYKEIWRSMGREAELYRVQDVIFWYADLLREMSFV